MIITLARLIIGGILMVLAYFIGKARGFSEGTRDSAPASHGPTRPRCIQTFYHGSSAEIAMLTPQPSKLTTEPVVFGTPSYTDAVIFSVQWTDYDFAMWGDGKKRYLEEQYPGAFAKLNRIGYIHHVRGTDTTPFKPIGFGINGEHTCTEAATPFRVDKMNVYNYLLDIVAASGENSSQTVVAKPSYMAALDAPRRVGISKDQDPHRRAAGGQDPHRRELPLVMRTYAEAVAARKTAEPIVIKGNIICHIVPADMGDSSVAELCQSHGIRAWLVSRHNIDNIDLSEPCIMIGNPVVGNTRYEFSCVHIYQRVNFDAMVALFPDDGKTTKKEYSQYLHATRDLYSDYVWMNMEQLDIYLSSLVARMKAKTQ